MFPGCAKQLVVFPHSLIITLNFYTLGPQPQRTLTLYTQQPTKRARSDSPLIAPVMSSATPRPSL
jgi:hypothetical protein